MKIKTMLLPAAIIPLLVSCASQPITLAPVGPSPLASGSSSGGAGCLEVFSGLRGVREGDNPAFYKHTDYSVYDARGKLVKHVENTLGRYERSPRRVALPPGNYIVRARAKEWLSVKVPVVIEPDRTTTVHLDENWPPPQGTPKSDLVISPDGYPVGWRAERT